MGLCASRDLCSNRTEYSVLSKRKCQNASADAVPPAIEVSNGSVAGLHYWGGHTREKIAWEVHRGDATKVLATIKAERFHCAVTSPPYFWQRDYEVEGQIGKEPKIEDYVASIAVAMDQVKRVLRRDGLLFLNLGDTYYSAKGEPKGPDRKNGARRFGLRAVDASGLGLPRKTAIGIPWRVALEMVKEGWTLRSPIVWRRDASLPEPTAKDRPWRTYEMIFMFSKSPHYHFSRKSLGGEEDIWNISSRPKNTKGVHSAAFPEELVEKCLRIGCLQGGEVLDPFAGSGTVLRVALKSQRPAFGIDLSQRFCDHMARELNAL
jgi:DNA modification methylase